MKERLGSFEKETEELIKVVQKGKCFFLKSRQIEVFHHEPPIRELLLAGISPSNIQFCFGLCKPSHAVIHAVRYELWGDLGDRNAFRGIRGTLDDNDRRVMESLLSGESKIIMRDLILRRRDEYLDGKIRS